MLEMGSSKPVGVHWPSARASRTSSWQDTLPIVVHSILLMEPPPNELNCRVGVLHLVLISSKRMPSYASTQLSIFGEPLSLIRILISSNSSNEIILNQSSPNIRILLLYRGSLTHSPSQFSVELFGNKMFQLLTARNMHPQCGSLLALAW